MNIDKLVKAAKKIESLHKKQEERSRAWQQLARDASKPDADRREIDKRKRELDVCQVVNFSDAILDLIRALHAKAG